MSFSKKLSILAKNLWQSIGFRLSLGYLTIFFFGILLIWALVNNLLNQLIEETINEYGKTVAEQLAQSSIDDLVRGDLVSLQTQLDNLTKLETIITAAIYDVENRTLVQAGTTPNARKHINPDHIRNFPATITFDKNIAGKVIVSLDTTNLKIIHNRLNTGLSLGIFFIALLIIAVSNFLGKRTARLYNDLYQTIQSISPNKDEKEKQNINWDILSTSLKNIGDHLESLKSNSPKSLQIDTIESSNNLENGSYAELLIECTNFETLQKQVSHREFQRLLENFQNKIDQSRVIYHGNSFLVSGPYICLRFYAGNISEPPFQALCCAIVLRGLLANTVENSVNVSLQIRMAIHWQERENTKLPDLLRNHIYKTELEELQFLCNQATNGGIITTKNIKQFPSVAKHIKLELISGISEMDCYRVQKISDNYQHLLNKQIKQLSNL